MFGQADRRKEAGQHVRLKTEIEIPVIFFMYIFKNFK